MRIFICFYLLLFGLIGSAMGSESGALENLKDQDEWTKSWTPTGVFSTCILDLGTLDLETFQSGDVLVFALYKLFKFQYESDEKKSEDFLKTNREFLKSVQKKGAQCFCLSFRYRDESEELGKKGIQFSHPFKKAKLDFPETTTYLSKGIAYKKNGGAMYPAQGFNSILRLLTQEGIPFKRTFFLSGDPYYLKKLGGERLSAHPKVYYVQKKTNFKNPGKNLCFILSEHKETHWAICGSDEGVITKIRENPLILANQISGVTIKKKPLTYGEILCQMRRENLVERAFEALDSENATPLQKTFLLFDPDFSGTYQELAERISSIYEAHEENWGNIINAAKALNLSDLPLDEYILLLKKLAGLKIPEAQNTYVQDIQYVSGLFEKDQNLYESSLSSLAQVPDDKRSEHIRLLKETHPDPIPFATGLAFLSFFPEDVHLVQKHLNAALPVRESDYNEGLFRNPFKTLSQYIESHGKAETKILVTEFQGFEACTFEKISENIKGKSAEVILGTLNQTALLENKGHIKEFEKLDFFMNLISLPQERAEIVVPLIEIYREHITPEEVRIFFRDLIKHCKDIQDPDVAKNAMTHGVNLFKELKKDPKLLKDSWQWNFLDIFNGLKKLETNTLRAHATKEFQDFIKYHLRPNLEKHSWIGDDSDLRELIQTFFNMLPEKRTLFWSYLEEYGTEALGRPKYYCVWHNEMREFNKTKEGETFKFFGKTVQMKIKKV